MIMRPPKGARDKIFLGHLAMWLTRRANGPRDTLDVPHPRSSFPDGNDGAGVAVYRDTSSEQMAVRAKQIPATIEGFGFIECDRVCNNGEWQWGARCA